MISGLPKYRDCRASCLSGQARAVLHDMAVMFRNEAVLQDTAQDMMTQKVLQTISDIGVVQYRDGPRTVSASIPVPANKMEMLKQHCQKVWSVFRAFFESNFPGHEVVNCYAALDLEADLTWSQRREFIYALARHEDLPEADVWLRPQSMEPGTQITPLTMHGIHIQGHVLKN